MSALLEVHDAAVSFGGIHAVAGVSLAVPRGAIVGLIGPNGAGKTTLFNAISGLQRLDEGRIVFDGADVTALEAHERAARGLGRNFQNLGLMMDETAETNVLAALHLRAKYRLRDLALRPRRWWRGEVELRTRVDAALEAFDLGAERHRPVRDLSFATARFVELAAVVAAEPSLMLLDEPTTGLDVAELRVLAQTLRRVRDAGTTLLVIAHDVAFVLELCDHVYALAEGALLAEGAPEAVRRHPDVIRAYLGAAA